MLVGVAEVVRVFGVRRAVQRDEQDVVALPEDLLGAVAVVVVDVDDGDAGAALVEQVLCGERRVVEEAVATVEAAPGVVAGRVPVRPPSSRAADGPEPGSPGLGDGYRGVGPVVCGPSGRNTTAARDGAGSVI